MTAYYGIPGAAPFWHWTTLVHFALVALAGGFSFYTALLGLKNADGGRRLAWWALLFIALDLFMLWAESPARFRFTHFWLFLSFRPGAAIWWGAWGLATSALLLLLILFIRGAGTRILFILLALSSTVVLLYPGFALAGNAARPLWDHLLLALFPATGLLLALALLTPLGALEARRWFELLSWVSFLLALLFPLALAGGDAEQMRALALLLRRGLWFFIGLALLLVAALASRKNPALAAGCAFVGALAVRSWIVEEGQHSLFAQGY